MYCKPPQSIFIIRIKTRTELKRIDEKFIFATVLPGSIRNTSIVAHHWTWLSSDCECQWNWTADVRLTERFLSHLVFHSDGRATCNSRWSWTILSADVVEGMLRMCSVHVSGVSTGSVDIHVEVFHETGRSLHQIICGGFRRTSTHLSSNAASVSGLLETGRESTTTTLPLTIDLRMVRQVRHRRRRRLLVFSSRHSNSVSVVVSVKRFTRLPIVLKLRLISEFSMLCCTLHRPLQICCMSSSWSVCFIKV